MSTEWMDEALADDEGFRPTTIRTVVEDIRARGADGPITKMALVNQALVDEAGTIRYARMMAEVEAEALDQHVDSPIVIRGEDRYTAAELRQMAADAREAARTDFESSRETLIGVLKEQHLSPDMVVSRRTWDEVSSLDDDGYVSEQLEELGGLDELRRQAPAYVHPGEMDGSVRPREGVAIDVSRPAVPRDEGRDGPAPRERGRDRSREEAAPAAEDGYVPEQDRPFDEPVADHVERHRQEASRRPSGEPRAVGDVLKSFMAKHGRNPDGSKIGEPPEPAGGSTPEM